MTNEKTPHATTTTIPSDQPPAYSSPVIHPRQDHTTTTTTTTTTSTVLSTGNNSDEANAPPPSYKPKRTPSQEEIYIRELKAWAAEKSTMYPGAYGEDYGRVVAPLRQREQTNNGSEQQQRGAGGAQSLISRGLREQEQRGINIDESTDHALAGTPKPSSSSSWRRKDSGSELSTSHGSGTGAGWSSNGAPTSSSFSGGATSPGSHPGPSSFKRRMSSFMQKMKRQDDSSVMETNGRGTDPMADGRVEDGSEGSMDGVVRA